MALTLRHYQQRAVDDLRRSFRSGSRAPLLVLPTGGGKTIIFSVITASAAARGRRVLVLVHRRELIAQASAKLAAANVPHGAIAAGVPPTHHPVQVASVQTLIRRLPRIDWHPDLIIIDEAHHAAAGSWARILDHWPDALRLGVTATPCRLDGRGLAGAFDHLVAGPPVAQLIADGFLSPSRIYAPPCAADLTRISSRAGDYAADQAAERMNRPTVTGNAIDHYRRLCDGAPAIAFCCNAAHAEAVATQFRVAGYAAATILGTTPALVRDQLVTDLGRGILQVLVSVDVVSEGFDCPGATAAILLRPTQSEALYLQQVGRVLRPAPGKLHALILDHVGNVHRHGWPDDPRAWALDSQPRRKRADGTPAPNVRTCPECFAAFRPQLLCPTCGAYCAPPKPRQIKQVDGDLKELQREGARQRTAERRSARTLQQLIHVGQARGMRNPVAWAKHVHYARQLKNGA